MDDSRSSDSEIRLAMLGMVEGNGHPYSWSAIINGYDPQKMAQCPYPVISEYLGEQPLKEISIPSATVTHIWADDREQAEAVAETTYIQNVVAHPEDVIGEVDGIIIPTDDGDNHVDRVKPFIGTGIPVFIDKPLATNLTDLAQFVEWQEAGHPLASSSAIRYAPAVDELISSISDIGELGWLTNATHKNWVRYGIHAVEPLVRVLGPGFESVSCTRTEEVNVFTIQHATGTTISIGVNPEMRGGFGRMSAYGTEDSVSIGFSDTYSAFRCQLLSVIEFIDSHEPDAPFSETVDLMACIIAGRWSQVRGRPVEAEEIYDSLTIPLPT